MATVIWRGLQGISRARRPYSVNASVGGTYTFTHNKKPISYTAVTGDTGTTVAAAIAALMTASAEPEWRELEASSSAAVLTILGPADGGPFTLSTAVTGSATITAGSAVSPVSPHDIADAANYEGEALPSNSDTLVLPTDAADIRYGLTAWTSITGLTIIREADGPVVGLPDYRAQGYREYRVTRPEVPAAAVLINLSAQEAGQVVRLNLDTTATAVTINGQQGGALDAEQVEIVGGDTGCAVRLSNASVAVAAGVCTTLEGDTSAVRVEPGVTLGAVELLDCTSRLAANWTALDVRGGTLDVERSATGPLSLTGATCNWKGAGNFDNPQLYEGAVLSTRGGSAPITVTGVIANRHPTAVLDDTFTRIVRPYDVDLMGSGVEGLTVGTDARVTVDDRP